jgi:hypothetical protein
MSNINTSTQISIPREFFDLQIDPYTLKVAIFLLGNKGRFVPYRAMAKKLRMSNRRLLASLTLLTNLKVVHKSPHFISANKRGFTYGPRPIAEWASGLPDDGATSETNDVTRCETTQESMSTPDQRPTPESQTVITHETTKQPNATPGSGLSVFWD